MREFFSQFGKVVDSTVMLDRETGRSKGFGFVSLEDVNVQPLLGFGNLEIDGKLVSTLSLSITLPFPTVKNRLMLNWRNQDTNVITSKTKMAALPLETTSKGEEEPPVAVSTPNKMPSATTQLQEQWPLGAPLLIPKHWRRSTHECSRCQI